MSYDIDEDDEDFFHTADSLRDKVRCGMRFLDRYAPEWRTNINIDKIDAGSVIDCVVSQTFGHYNYAPFNRDGEIQRSYCEYEMGFNINDEGHSSNFVDRLMEELTRIWKSELRK
jgi:hypothetical protein